MMELVRAQLGEHIDEVLVDKLLEHYTELKRRYYLGDHEPGELNGAKFAEVVIRILQHLTGQTFTPLEQRIENFERTAMDFRNLPRADYPDSIRLHIPRVLIALYDIRNNRSVGHVHGDLSPNLPDATFVMTACDWVLSELLRLYYGVSPDEAQKMVNSIVEIKLPVVYDFEGVLQVLNSGLSVPNKILVLLHYRRETGTTLDELTSWLKGEKKGNIKLALWRLEVNRVLIHFDGTRYRINPKGELYLLKKVPLHITV